MTNNDFSQEVNSIIQIAKKINIKTPADNQLVNDYVNELKFLLNKGWKYAFYRADEIDEALLPDKYIKQRNQVIEDLQIKLGQFAVKYRAAIPNSSSEKRALAEYYETFDELVRINGGILALDPDTELPDSLMPKEYLAFWSQG